MREQTTVLVCDDHTLFREGIKEILKDQPWISILGEAHNGREAIHEARRLAPRLVLLDLSMPDLGGLEATHRILRENPGTSVIILTMYEEEEVISRCLRAGASAYVLKDAPRSDLLHAMDVVLSGGQYLSSRALKKVVTNHHDNGRTKTAATPYERLTDREREVLKLVAEGLALKEVAHRLALSVKTADSHKTNMMRKLDLHDRGEVIRYAIQQKLIRVN
ncbi:MAG TPA: response regulator transcription factor [Bryobacteraceae bacterium]|jgi:two-component system response regulator NreC|nr:response regulator transcription factor [Bryobacteraceae bacterium]